MTKTFVGCYALWVGLACGQENFLTTTDSIRFRGSISNSFFLPDGLSSEIRRFEVKVSAAGSSYDITNAAMASFHATLKSGEIAHYFEQARTSRSGVVSNTVAAQIESRPCPRDDGSWVNYLWLAFGCHSYFTNRPDDRALPIWRTALLPRDEDEARMNITASYTALHGSPFPAEVRYLIDGFDYVRGPTKGILQKIPLRPPLDTGYAVFTGQAITFTNVGGFIVPVQFDITRYAPLRSGNSTTGALRVLTYTSIAVDSINVVTDLVETPRFRGTAVAVDLRTANPTSQVRMVLRRMTNGNWPNIQETQNQHRLLEIAFEESKKRELKTAHPRRTIVWIAFAIMAVLPLVLYLLRAKGNERT